MRPTLGTAERRNDVALLRLIATLALVLSVGATLPLDAAAQGQPAPDATTAKADVAPDPEGARRNLDAILAKAAKAWAPFNSLPGTANGGRAGDWLNPRKWMDFDKALPYSTQLVAAYPTDPDVLRLHHFILSDLKRWKEAEEFGVKIIPIVEKSGDKECLFWVIRNQVHTVWKDDHAVRDPAHSRTLHQYKGSELADRVVALAEELDNDNLRFRAYFLQAIWVEHSLAGHQWDRAIEFYKKALAISEKNGWTDRASDAMGGVAEVLACTGKLDESEEWSRKAGARPHPFVAARRQRWQPMYEQNRPSIDAYEALTLREPNERLQREVIGWNERGAYDYTILACMNMNKEDEAVEVAERLHNRTLGTILGAHSADGRATLVAQRRQDRAQAATRVALLEKQTPTEAAQRDLKVQAAELQQLDADIAADELEVAAAATPPRMSLKDMQAVIPPDAAVVLYFVSWSPFMKQGFIAVITDRSFKFYPRKGLVIGTYEKQGLQPHIEPYLTAVQTPAPGPDAQQLRKANDVLYQLLLAPIAEDIKTRKQLIIIPGGPLAQVPIHLLRDETGRALIEDHPVSYAPSFGVLRHTLARNRKVGGEVTVVANPALAAPGASLKFAELEAEAIRKVFADANVLAGDRATESAVRAALTRAGVLHFACHGILDTDYPMKSALALTPDGGNDGMLTAREICDFPVKAGLVVLSACQTGAGTMSAGWIELVGMSRAWFLAGAPSTVVSLWRLDDKATAELMTEFYSNLKTTGRAEALQRAQVAMMKLYDNPYYWGAFVLYGDYR